MWPSSGKRSFEGVGTDLGRTILKDLKSDGWEITSEYSDQMFDKGIDFDAYTLEREGCRIDFEWTNWQEWTMTGPPETMAALAARYPLDKSEP